ncbi:unnamed protein product [Symbiodinium sp. KB8]|nr:unnamed protein product [Symbiodinium sp. KB8]
MNAKPLPRPSFGVPRAGPKHVPIQLGSAGVPQQPRPLPTYRSASSYAVYPKVIKERLLSKVSDTTASRYLRSVQLFFVAFEELGGKLEQINEGLFLDAFFTVSRSSEDGPLSNSQNVLKALRWYKKLLGLVTLPDLYGSAFSLMSASSEQEKKESIPLPLIFVAFLEGILLSSTSSLEDQIASTYDGHPFASVSSC